MHADMKAGGLAAKSLFCRTRDFLSPPRSLLSGDLADEAALIVPVRLYYTRPIQRGFNPSAWLAQAIGQGAGRCVSVDVLRRTRQTAGQAGFSMRVPGGGM